jgi:hypothetical protein
VVDPEDEGIMIFENITPSNTTVRTFILDRYHLDGTLK